MQYLSGESLVSPILQVILGLSETGCNGYISSREGIHLVANPSDGDGRRRSTASVTSGRVYSFVSKPDDSFRDAEAMNEDSA